MSAPARRSISSSCTATRSSGSSRSASTTRHRSGCAGSGRSPAARTGRRSKDLPVPVHLNFPLREPLVLDEPLPDDGSGRPGREPWVVRPHQALASSAARPATRRVVWSSRDAGSATECSETLSLASPSAPATRCWPIRSRARATALRRSHATTCSCAIRRSPIACVRSSCSASATCRPRSRCARGWPRSMMSSRWRSTPRAPGRTPPRCSPPTSAPTPRRRSPPSRLSDRRIPTGWPRGARPMTARATRSRQSSARSSQSRWWRPGSASGFHPTRPCSSRPRCRSATWSCSSRRGSPRHACSAIAARTESTGPSPRRSGPPPARTVRSCCWSATWRSRTTSAACSRRGGWA